MVDKKKVVLFWWKTPMNEFPSKFFIFAGDSVTMAFIDEMRKHIKILKEEELFGRTLIFAKYKNRKFGIVSGLNSYSDTIQFIHSLSLTRIKELLYIGSCGGIGIHDPGSVIIPKNVELEYNVLTRFSKKPKADKQLIKTLTSTLENQAIPYHIGSTVETPFVWPEENKDFKRWINKKIIGVDLQTGPILAITGKMRKKAAALLVTIDSDKNTLYELKAETFQKRTEKVKMMAKKITKSLIERFLK